MSLATDLSISGSGGDAAASLPSGSVAANDVLAHAAAKPVSRIDLRRWGAACVAVDTLAAAIAGLGVLFIRFGVVSNTAPPIRYGVLAGLMVPSWLVAMALSGSYDRRHLAAGSQQYRRVINGSVWILALFAFGSFALHADLSRGFVLVSIPEAALLTIAGRYAVRKTLHRHLSSGCAIHRVMAIGLASEVRSLVTHVNRAPFAGLRVVAAMTPDQAVAPELPAGVAWAGADIRSAVERAQKLGADTIAVVTTQLLEEGRLRRLSWELEGTDMDLILAPAITDIAGPRISTRPIDGLPLLCVEKPQFTGPSRLAKEAIDKLLSALGLLALSPVLAVIAIVVKLTSTGPVVYRQQRVGASGECFWLLKFRSMHEGADSAQDGLREANEHDGPLFKIRRDPRLTPVGGSLRRWSLDELLQLWNVFVGEMSLVGPRPALPIEVARYGIDVQRRLLVKPGMTGLWQISGRADLSWEERVRLDLYYVDHWSVGLDLIVLIKTFLCVVRGAGAY